MSNLEVLNLNGTYHVDDNSDSMEDILKIQGVNWAVRKIAAKVSNSMILTIEQNTERLVIIFKTPIKLVLKQFHQFV